MRIIATLKEVNRDKCGYLNSGFPLGKCHPHTLHPPVTLLQNGPMIWRSGGGTSVCGSYRAFFLVVTKKKKKKGKNCSWLHSKLNISPVGKGPNPAPR